MFLANIYALWKLPWTTSSRKILISDQFKAQTGNLLNIYLLSGVLRF